MTDSGVPPAEGASASLSFDSMAHLYDDTRTCDEASLTAALAYLADRLPPATYPKVFEPGIGTGRIALRLAEYGYSITGVDISARMLEVLHQHVARLKPAGGITSHLADLCALPFRDEAFDLAIAVHLFYFVGDWRTAVNEALRVVRASGPLVIMQTGLGKEIPALNARYRDLCAASGFPLASVGANNTFEVLAYCHALGCRFESIRQRWQWTYAMRLDEALGHMRNRAYAFTTNVPSRLHADVVNRMEDELVQQYGDTAKAIDIRDQVSMVFIWKR